MSKPDIFVGRLREGAFTIIASTDTTSTDPDATCLELILVESDALYRGKFSDAQLSNLCIGSRMGRTIKQWFSDLEVFRRTDESVVVFLMEKRIIRIMATLKKIDLESSQVLKGHQKYINLTSPARISEWSDECDITPATTEIPELTTFTTEFAELKRRYPYINVELPIESPALKRLRTCYSSDSDSESSDHD